MSARSEAWSRLRADRPLRFALWTGAALVLVYTTPILATEWLVALDAFVAEPLLLVLATGVMGLAAWKSAAEERRFWCYLALGHGFWLLAHWLDTRGLEGRGALSIDLGYLLLYFSLTMATEIGPHRNRGWTRSSLQYRFGVAGAWFFAVGMLCYLVLIPGVLDPRAYETLIPSYLLYVILDVYLSIRFLVLSRRAASARWKAVFGLLSVTTGLWLLNDVLEWLNMLGTVYIGRDSPLALLWYSHFFAAFAAARLGGVRFAADTAAAAAEEHGAREWPGSRLPAWPLIAYGFVFATLHLSLYSAEVLAPAGRPARELLVLALLVVFGVLALAQQELLRRHEIELRRDLRAARVELQRSQRLEALGRLAGGVAHDFNNLLTVISGSTELIRTHCEDPHVDRLCDTLGRTSAQGRALTDQLMAVGSKQSRRPRRIEVGELIAEASPLLADLLGSGITLRHEVAAADAYVDADPTQLQQVLLNLAANARDAMPQGGTCGVRVVEVGDDPAGGWPGPGPWVAIEFDDDGSGMDRETLDHLFEPFFTTRGDRGGTGLGLATVYGIVKSHGGTIRVESAPGEGTRFTVYLPRAASAAAAVAVRVEPADGEPTVLPPHESPVPMTVLRRS